MPGIDEVNKRLTPEERRERASKAGKAPKRKRVKTLRQLAKMLNDMPAPAGARQMLNELGVAEDDMTNAAMVVAAVLRSAFDGDLRAVEKWEKYTGQADDKREKLENKLLEEKLKKGGSDVQPVEVVIAPRGSVTDEEDS